MVSEYKKTLEILPLLSLALICLHSWVIISDNQEGITYSKNNIIGTALLIIDIVLMIRKPGLGKVFLFFIIILWMFGLLDMSHYFSYASYGIRIGGVKISTPQIEIRAFFLFIICCLVYRQDIKKIFKGILNLIDGN
jgi:hypothetical protein